MLCVNARLRTELGLPRKGNKNRKSAKKSKDGTLTESGESPNDALGRLLKHRVLPSKAQSHKHILLRLIHKGAAGNSSHTCLANQELVKLSCVFKPLRDANPRIKARPRRIDVETGQFERSADDLALAREIRAQPIVITRIARISRASARSSALRSNWP